MEQAIRLLLSKKWLEGYCRSVSYTYSLAQEFPGSWHAIERIERSHTNSKVARSFIVRDSIGHTAKEQQATWARVPRAWASFCGVYGEQEELVAKWYSVIDLFVLIKGLGYVSLTLLCLSFPMMNLISIISMSNYA